MTDWNTDNNIWQIANSTRTLPKTIIETQIANAMPLTFCQLNCVLQFKWSESSLSNYHIVAGHGEQYSNRLAGGGGVVYIYRDLSQLFTHSTWWVLLSIIRQFYYVLLDWNRQRHVTADIIVGHSSISSVASRDRPIESWTSAIIIIIVVFVAVQSIWTLGTRQKWGLNWSMNELEMELNYKLPLDLTQFRWKNATPA